MPGLMSLLTAVGAGMLTFVSPCVLPLVPGYLAFLAGASAGEGLPEDRRTTPMLVPSLLFVAGFSAVFIALGASASALGSFLAESRVLLRVIAGIVIATFGVLMLGVVKVPWLYGEARFEMSRARRFGRAAAPVMGMTFALGWSPCVGPILGSILMMAASTADVGKGALLLAAYSLGLGVPFVLVVLTLTRIRPLLAWLSRRTLVVNRVAGAVLIILGVTVLGGWMGPVTGFVARFIPKFGG